MDSDEVTGRILVVDDEAMLARVMARRLSARGFTVDICHDGASALQRLDADAGIDLVLLDVMMPGMSGLDVLRAVRGSRGPEALPIIMLTSRSDAETVVEALQVGANDYVNKPAQLQVLLARVCAQLARKRADIALRASEERYALAARGSRDVLWDWDTTSDQLYMSQGASLIGAPDSGPAAGPYTGPAAAVQELVHPDDAGRIRAAVLRLLKEPDTHLDIEVRTRPLPGRPMAWVLIRGCSVRDEAGQVVRVAGSISDLSAPRLHDPITGLPNRALFLEQLRNRLGQATGSPPGVLLVALDRAEDVSATLGSAAADQLVSRAAERIAGELSRHAAASPVLPGSLSQISSHEFGLLLHESCTPAATLRLASALKDALSKTFALHAAQVRSSASVGIAQGGGETTPEELLEHGLSAVARARTLPGGLAVFQEDAHARAVARLALESDLSAAIARGDLHLEYQPIVDLQSAEPVAVEALCRWDHPTRGRIPPDVFIPLAESTGLACDLGEWVLRRACADARGWFRSDGEGVRVCVNVSPLQFLESDLAAVVESALADTGLAPDRLEIELTEGVFAHQPERIQAVMARMRALGVRVALDDFGTGYSSLAYLVKFPLDTLKLDRSFVAKLPGGERSQAITRATLAMAHELGLEVVAEGIEQGEQATYLEELRCELGQGWHFGRPSRAEAWDELLLLREPVAK